jgi:thiamine-phosphate pyrophosphorylase
MELIVISNPIPVVDETILINNLFMAGLTCFHIRKPGADAKSLRELINGIAPRFYDRIALHQCHELAPEYGIKRLHYTERDRKNTSNKSRAVLKATAYVLSTSIHDLTLLPSLSDFDYTFYGPVFNSLSKPGYRSALPENFKLNKTGIPLKVMAIGGILPANLTTVKAMNFDGAAVLGAIWTQPQQAVTTLKYLTKNLPVSSPDLHKND